jgi:hypothetical protein
MIWARKVIHHRGARTLERNNECSHGFLALVRPMRSINAEAFTVENAHDLAFWSDYLESPYSDLQLPA